MHFYFVGSSQIHFQSKKPLEIQKASAVCVSTLQCVGNYLAEQLWRSTMATHRAASEHMLPAAPSLAFLFLTGFYLSRPFLYTTPLISSLLFPPSPSFPHCHLSLTPTHPCIPSSLASSQPKLTTEKTLTGSHWRRARHCCFPLHWVDRRFEKLPSIHI